MDVHNPFLHGDLDEDIYMKPPPEFDPASPHLVYNLKMVFARLHYSGILSLPPLSRTIVSNSHH